MKTSLHFPLFLLFSLMALIGMSGCVSREQLVLFQDADDYMDSKRIGSTYDIRIQADDRLAIAIASQDKELVDVFNNKMLIGSSSSGSSGGSGGGSSKSDLNSTFHVDNDGFIEFPIFGKIYVEGLSRKAIADTIQNRLRNGFINDAVVSVELLSFHVLVIGGPKTETILTVDKDRFTIIEALTMAGGFRPGSFRENVLVVREEAGEVWTYRVDFTKMADLLNSPVYYLQQNDIVYIEPGSSALLDESAGQRYIQTITTIVTSLISMTAIVVALF